MKECHRVSLLRFSVRGELFGGQNDDSLPDRKNEQKHRRLFDVARGIECRSCTPRHAEGGIVAQKGDVLHERIQCRCADYNEGFTGDIKCIDRDTHSHVAS
jgi:hypothetical protein